MTIQRLSHIGICVSNLEKSSAFYRAVFGFELLSELEVKGDEADTLLGIEGVDFTAVYLERDNTRIELLCYRNPPFIDQTSLRPMNRVGLTHLSFRVSDMDEALAAVKAAGGQCLEGTRINNPDYHMQGIFVLDPDGMRIELLEAPGDPDLLPGMQ